MSYADIARELGCAKSTVSYHARQTSGLIPDERFGRRYDWQTIEQFIISGHTPQQASEKFGFSYESWWYAYRSGKVQYMRWTPDDHHVNKEVMILRKERRRKYDVDRYRSRRDDIVSRLGGRCVRCGSLERLQIDHIHPADKELDISSSIRRPLYVLYNEIEKCQLLCEICHREKTKVDIRERYPIRHGTISGYDRGCRCGGCREMKRISRNREKILE